MPVQSRGSWANIFFESARHARVLARLSMFACFLFSSRCSWKRNSFPLNTAISFAKLQCKLRTDEDRCFKPVLAFQDFHVVFERHGNVSLNHSQQKKTTIRLGAGTNRMNSDGSPVTKVCPWTNGQDMFKTDLEPVLTIRRILLTFSESKRRVYLNSHENVWLCPHSTTCFHTAATKKLRSIHLERQAKYVNICHHHSMRKPLRTENQYDRIPKKEFSIGLKKSQNPTSGPAPGTH